MSSDQMIEVQGPDVEAAIASGLEALGLKRDDVIVEIIDEGRKGILGLGSKEATVRLTPLAIRGPRPEKQESAKAVEPPAAKGPPAAEEAVAEAPKPGGAMPDSKPAPSEHEERAQDEELEAVVTEIVSNLLEKMGFAEAVVRLDRTEPDEKTGRVMTVAQVEGQDLSSLIGPHGETLNDFQYVARLMAGHALRRRADFIIDVDGYRSQRKASLTSLAERMAKKAVERGSAVTLEPMSSYDRRIVHMALRDRDDVYTSSVGEGSNRRVRIYLKDSE
jgi:spoIIIJ-associated protein